MQQLISPLHALHTLTNRLLDAASDDYAVLLNTTRELYELLVKHAALDPEAIANRNNNHLQTGKAIGATWAAMCIQDLLRTKKFMDGLYHAVTRLHQENSGRSIHILYAGTGPFATLVLPLTARFGSDQLQFTLLEVNETSYQCLQRTIDVFQLDPYVHDTCCTDAATHIINTDAPVDILLSETMQHALIKEPQVAIVMNLLPQLPPGCLLIPENIILEAVLVNQSKRTQWKMGHAMAEEETIYKLGRVFEVNKDTILKQVQATDIPHYEFSPVKVEIPSMIIPRFPTLQILTTIRIFQTDQLLPDQCALTLPLTIADLSASFPKEIIFKYVPGTTPGLACSLFPQ